MMKDTLHRHKSQNVIYALKMVLTALDSMLIPGIEADKMKATRKVVEDCIIELEGQIDGFDTYSEDGGLESGCESRSSEDVVCNGR